jgi:ABC-2 type transport system ATP-binding protein
MTEIIVEDLSVDFPVTSIRGVTLRQIALAKAQRIGGHVVEETATVKVVRGLDNLCFRLKEGDRLGLIGPNGAGKTTLIRVLAGIYAPTSGAVTVRGRALPMFDISLGIDDEATGFENIYMRGLIMGLTETQIAARTDDIAAFSELGSYLGMPVRTYSSGMLLRLLFSIATAIDGDIVLMDEWLTVGDQDFRLKAQRRLEDITSKSGILVLATHDYGLLRATCTLGLHMENGRVRHFGGINEVLDKASE